MLNGGNNYFFLSSAVAFGGSEYCRVVALCGSRGKGYAPRVAYESGCYRFAGFLDPLLGDQPKLVQRGWIAVILDHALKYCGYRRFAWTGSSGVVKINGHLYQILSYRINMIIIAHIYPQGNSGEIFRGNKFMLSGGELPQAEPLPYVN